VSHDGDWGQAPAEVREQILSHHGHYYLCLEDAEVPGGVTLKVFRQVIGGSLVESQEFISKLRQGGFAGTLVETELLSEKLRLEGVLTIVTPNRC
jgi:hypothetical protein